MNDGTITLHPMACDLLFEHYRNISRIFRDVLGQLEIDYMAIAIITPKDELMFFSSHPGTEWNLIKNNLWQFDTRFQFQIKQEQASLWKQKPDVYSLGFSLSSKVDEFRVVYTFACKSTNTLIQQKIFNNIAMLTRLGRFCFKNILQELFFLNPKSDGSQQKSHLTLIVNNKVSYERST